MGETMLKNKPIYNPQDYTPLTLRGEEIIPGAVNGVRNWYEKNRPSVKKSDTHLLNRVKSANRDYLENQEWPLLSPVDD